MATGRFGGPLASELAAFAATLEAGATANKTTLTQLRALDRFTAQRDLPSGTIDETLAKAWLAGCDTVAWQATSAGSVAISPAYQAALIAVPSRAVIQVAGHSGHALTPVRRIPGESQEVHRGQVDDHHVEVGALESVVEASSARVGWRRLRCAEVRGGGGGARVPPPPPP